MIGINYIRELVLRVILLLGTIVLTCYILYLYNVTLINLLGSFFTIIGIDINFLTDEYIQYICIYIAILLNIPMFIITIYMYISSIIVKHNIKSLMRTLIFFIFLVYSVNIRGFSVVLPMLLISIVDVYISFGLEYILKSDYRLYLIFVARLLTSVYRISIFYLFTNKIKRLSKLVRFRQIIVISVLLLYVFNGNIPFIIALMIIFFILFLYEFIVLLYLFIVNLVKKS